MRFFRLLGFTVQFMTRIPIKKQFNVTEKDFAAMTMFFPASSLIVGLIMAGVYWLLALAGLSWVAAVAAVLAACLATGGLHIDGFADMCDAFGARKSPERTLEILKDSRMGTYGVLALVFVVLLKIVMIGSIKDFNIYLILIGIPVAGKIPLAICAAAGKYPREDGTGRLMINNITAKESIVCIIISLIILYFCMGWISLLLLPVLLAAGFIMKAISQSRIGGVTGDILGAANEIGELLWLLFAAVMGTAL
jgi:adenosylcobinamide-GDP ribazoletransferase